MQLTSMDEDTNQDLQDHHIPSLIEDRNPNIEDLIIGVERLSPTSVEGKFKPKVSSSLKPAVGMIFESLDATFEFYKTYAKEGGFSVRRGSQVDKDGIIRYKYFTCSKEGHKPQKKSDLVGVVFNGNKPKKCRSRPSIRTGCQAHILVFSDDGTSYKIHNFVEGHNHRLTLAEDMQFLPSNRNLTIMQKKRICSLATLNLGPVKSFHILRAEYGGFEEIGATAVDIKNFKRDLNVFIGEYDAEMIVQRLVNKRMYLHDFSFDYTVDENGHLTGLFWADEIAKRNYLTFGDVISFDATFNTNKYKMVFVPFTGIDNHFRNVNLGAGLLAKETIESYMWLLSMFLKAFGHQPKVVVTDQDPAMKQAIENVFRESRHRLCMWHIMKKVADKVGSALCNDENFKRRLCNIVWTDSIEPDEFEREWVMIVIEFGLIDNSWISTMFDLRSTWIPAYYRDEYMSGLMRTTSRSESENQFFGIISNSQLTLVEFFSHFDTAIEAQRYVHRKNDHDTRNTVPDMWTEEPIEVEAAKIYTRSIFFDVQEEIYASIHKCHSVHVVDGGKKVYIRDKEAIGKGFLEVVVNNGDGDFSISCSCKRFEQYGLLCRHIFYVFKMNDIEEFPEKYVLKRWRSEIVSNKANCSFFTEGNNNVDIDKAHAIVREIMHAGEYLSSVLFTDLEELSKVRDQMKSMVEKAEEGRHSRSVLKKKELMASFVGYDQPSSSTVRVPTGIRNKGRGSHKRILSKKEKTISRIGKRTRTCSVCGGKGHDIRTCKDFPKEMPNVQT